MKLVVVGLTLLFVSYSHQDDDDKLKKFMDIRDKCVKETGVEESLINTFVEVSKFKDNQPFKCYLKCILVGFGTMTEDGTLLVEEYKKAHLDVPPEQWSQIVDKCKSVKGGDACETAFLLSECVEDNVKNF